MKDAIRMLVSFQRKNKTKKRALIKYVSKPENLKKLNKIQSVYRGFAVRNRHRDAIK